MSYAQAVRGSLTHNGLLREVDCQSEVELGRCLDPSEKAVLYSRFPPDIVVRRIHQVCNFSKALSYLQDLTFLVWLWCLAVYVVPLQKAGAQM